MKRSYICWMSCCVNLFIVIVVVVDVRVIYCSMLGSRVAAAEAATRVSNVNSISNESMLNGYGYAVSAKFNDYEVEMDKDTNSNSYYTSTRTGKKMRSIVWIGVQSWLKYRNFMDALCRADEAELPELNDDAVVYTNLYFLWEKQMFHDELIKILVLENNIYRRPHFIGKSIQSHCSAKYASKFVDIELENLDIQSRAHFENRINKYVWEYNPQVRTVPYTFD